MWHMYGSTLSPSRVVNTLRQRQIGCLSADDIFNYIFFDENAWTPRTISLRCVPKGSNNNIPALPRNRQNGYLFADDIFNIFSSMNMFEFRERFHWSLFLRVQLTIFQHWFRLWLGADQAASHYLIQWWLIYWRIYASLVLKKLSCHSTNCFITTKEVTHHL